MFLNHAEKLEDADDIKTAREVSYRIRQGEEETLPAHVVRELVHSAHPLRVWREYRGLTLQSLAEQVGISKSYLSQIESGHRSGSADVLKRIAAALQLTLDDIVGA
ncbi:MAG: helix-turn-helix transcriptional regulator [Anaerolinea sp.]|nr:helix-turn-helix transcriptional regulator [Anaerolinea sp.]